jgi:hypothetical protein
VRHTSFAHHQKHIIGKRGIYWIRTRLLSNALYGWGGVLIPDLHKNRLEGKYERLNGILRLLSNPVTFKRTHTFKRTYGNIWVSGW